MALADHKGSYTHYVLADVTNSFQRALFHHFRAAWIGDILCEQAYQVAPLTSGQFGTRDVSDALCSRTGSNCFCSQRLQDLQTEIAHCGFEKMKCVSLMTNFLSKQNHAFWCYNSKYSKCNCISFPQDGLSKVTEVTD